MNMGYVYAVFAVVCAILFIASCITWAYDGANMFFQMITSLSVSIVCIIAAVQWFNGDEPASSPVIDLDNCRYVGAEVYTSDDDHTVFIDITSGDGALYAYDGQVDATAQYMLTLDAKTGEVLVVWQNVN